ncbi:tRNA (adenosine(37)-N6)-threonylcarbamoyltransferase complex ATPase subunit type 1 TsaE [Gracilibacillus alcaliphilus]|uniref:tRNA (adenosine(37)-N6)-threonylcarbamoyltransferase complex ATPase subunit type 1 TsaE n=1 Tax=Gracilibacillus alcaliphilus TaxID=1401441 RepID=UPI0019586676|nr:tRNA (adenosine(37)-N6)-threonylcarbamoyltransferase complex ATPase subunit type 1 TsaE [Gracilibacillus alcaliphilus]MBM7679627.1 tRNA threonylcarbamoyladenosine biosynthesis protein TsaE [Gracilibacillus alcaliphilus]
MKKYCLETGSETETKQLAHRLAKLLTPGDVITLEGDLGTGKTTFTKGLGEGLGITRTINSPTFTIVKEYMGALPFYHMDVYRLENSDEDIGFDEYFHSDGITVIEWAQFIEEYLPAERLNIYIERIDDKQRRIMFQPNGAYFDTVCKELVQ